MMPFAFCTREKKWCEFAEPIDGESTQFLQGFARKYNMVIISPILERDMKHGETIWNTAIIIGNHGNIIGKHRKVTKASIWFWPRSVLPTWVVPNCGCKPLDNALRYHFNIQWLKILLGSSQKGGMNFSVGLGLFTFECVMHLNIILMAFAESYT